MVLNSTVKPESLTISSSCFAEGYDNFTRIISRKIETQNKEQNIGIIGTNLSKIHLVSYNSYA